MTRPHDIIRLLAIVLCWLIIANEIRPNNEIVAVAPIFTSKTIEQIPEVSSSTKHPDFWAMKFNERPLFIPSRTPSVNTIANQEASITGLPRLIGIIMTVKERKAVFVDEGGHLFFRLEGASVDGFSIQRITIDRVIITSPDGSFVLRPSFLRSEAGSSEEPNSKHIQESLYPQIPTVRKQSPRLGGH